MSILDFLWHNDLQTLTFWFCRSAPTAYHFHLHTQLFYYPLYISALLGSPEFSKKQWSLKGCQGGCKTRVRSLSLGLERAYLASSQSFLLFQALCKTQKRTCPVESSSTHSNRLWFPHYWKILLVQLKYRSPKTKRRHIWFFFLQLSQLAAHSSNVENGKIKGDRNVSLDQSQKNVW